ncbi:MAG: L-seryl-tRNA(Sec) selenium transferase [Desulfobacteraceae bacterium]|nr:MAG: L-seryl-tRNA(Sec) selenium transferase [Desulfobacteraceae bacterium]
MSNTQKHDLLKHLPGVDSLLDQILIRDDTHTIPRRVMVSSIRTVLDDTRKQILEDRLKAIDETSLIQSIIRLAQNRIKPRLVPLINATGVVLHTNLGRALLCDDALENIKTISGSYSNLEFNIQTGKRGIRYQVVEELICELTGAQSAIVVNNNAAAVLLALNTMAQCQEVIVSRGELVEIGGSFRIPDVMTRSGCILKEVGTTNRTHPRDYEQAINENTGLLLKVHTSNYQIQGFTKSVPIADLAAIGKRCSIKVMEDLGSGTLIDFGKYGLPKEPTVKEAVASGADVITFSGDKLLGGPQAGIIVGSTDTIDRIKANPLTRALRIDKMTLAALESTLNLYRDEDRAMKEIPTLRMLTRPLEEIQTHAGQLRTLISDKQIPNLEVETADMTSRPGGGSYPALLLPTCCVTLKPGGLSVSRLEKLARFSTPPLIGRIEEDRFILDPRTIQPGQETIIADTLETIILKELND